MESDENEAEEGAQLGEEVGTLLGEKLGAAALSPTDLFDRRQRAESQVEKEEEEAGGPFQPASDSSALPLMSERGERLARKTGSQKNWALDDKIETHDWSRKYGVPFPRGKR